MAVLFSEAYEAGFSAGAARTPFDTAWTAYNTTVFALLPLRLKREFKRGYSSAIGYAMDAY